MHIALSNHGTTTWLWAASHNGTKAVNRPPVQSRFADISKKVGANETFTRCFNVKMTEWKFV
jgi:hypothetical protein